MWIPILRLSIYVALGAATSPIVGAYDYGSNGAEGGGLWTRLLASLVLAVIMAVIGETGLRIARRLRRH